MDDQRRAALDAFVATARRDMDERSAEHRRRAEQALEHARDVAWAQFERACGVTVH